MRATASHDVVIAECEVPREFTLAVLDSREGFAEPAERFDDGLYGLPLVPLLALAATAPALGAAEAALASFIARTQTRVLAYTFTQAREAVGPRMRIGACHSRVAAIRSLFDRLVARVESARQGGERLTLAERAEIRLGCSLIVHESRQIVDELCAGAGASVHFLDHPLQRTQRDLNTLCGHVMFDRDTSQELFGSVAVGMELPPLAML
jgi:alkylation response protein AidB-like acyl-CoA dehydrogenase